MVNDGIWCLDHSRLVLVLEVIHHCMNLMGLSQISYCSVPGWPDCYVPLNQTMMLVMWLSTCPTSSLRSHTPGPQSRICCPTILKPWSVLLNMPKMLLHMTMLLVLWSSVGSPLLGSQSLWSDEHGSSRSTSILGWMSRWFLMLLHTRCFMSHRSRRSPSLTPIDQLFPNYEGLLDCIVKCMRH
jgi:hypothetical protein